MARVFPSIRTECRTPKKVLVELHSFESAAHEVTSTVNVSLHGARVLTKAPWPPNQDVSVRSYPGHLHSHAHIVYCRPFRGDSYSVGLELREPNGDWPAFSKPSSPPHSY